MRATVTDGAMRLSSSAMIVASSSYVARAASRSSGSGVAPTEEAVSRSGNLKRDNA
jgi:hypothetical protein